MKSTSLIALLLLLYAAPFAAQSQPSPTEPYGFQDLRLGVLMSEFRIKHPAPVENGASPLPGQARCGSSATLPLNQVEKAGSKGITRCGYSETFLGILLRIGVTFVDGKLAEISLSPEADGSGCFAPFVGETAATSAVGADLYMEHCQQIVGFWHSLTDNLGRPTLIPFGEKEKRIYALRWENSTSIAEFQNHLCGPFERKDSDSRQISEVLDGRYCITTDSLSYRQNVMIYLDKELGRTLATREAGPVPDTRIFHPGVGGVGYPTCLYCPAANYSDEAVFAKFSGTVLLQVVIDPDGYVRNIEVLKDPGFDLRDKAVQNVSTWRFIPAPGPDGKPVSVLQSVSVTFNLSEDKGSTSPRKP